MSDIDLDQLAERIESLEDELEAEREERRRLEDELEEERERRRALEDELEDRSIDDLLEDRSPEGEPTNFSDIWLAGQPLGRLVNRTQDRVKDLEKRLEDESPEAAEAVDEDAPPIYTLLRTPEDALKPTERRTRFLWADLSDYASRTPKGYVLPASDARRVLEAAEPEDSDASRIDANHVGRVFDLSVDLTRGAAFVRRKDGERHLVVPTNWEEEAREAVA